MSVYFRFTPDGLDVAIDRLSQLDGLEAADLLEVIGAIVESQTRRRLSEEKETPAGKGWVGWGRKYARTRKPHHSLLESEGDLIGSIDHQIFGGSRLLVGSALRYAARHQFGDHKDEDGIPARPYIGMSPDGRTEVQDVIADFIGARLEGK